MRSYGTRFTKVLLSGLGCNGNGGHGSDPIPVGIPHSHLSQYIHIYLYITLYISVILFIYFICSRFREHYPFCERNFYVTFFDLRNKKTPYRSTGLICIRRKCIFISYTYPAVFSAARAADPVTDAATTPPEVAR